MAHLPHDHCGRDFECVFQFRMFVGFIAVAAIGAEIQKKNTDVVKNSTAPTAATTVATAL